MKSKFIIFCLFFICLVKPGASLTSNCCTDGACRDCCTCQGPDVTTTGYTCDFKCGNWFTPPSICSNCIDTTSDVTGCSTACIPVTTTAATTTTSTHPLPTTISPTTANSTSYCGKAFAAAGRARIEQQKQTALANIQKNREAALTALTIQYANADKAKTSFGYIGITFLVVLFGSIFMNDFIKLCIYYFNGWREWWRGNENDREQLNNRNNETVHEVKIDLDHVYGDDLEERLERVYIRLLEVNANRRK